MKTKIASGIMATLLILGPFMISPISSADTLPRMYLVPPSATVDQGSIVTLDVYVENVNDMYAWEFRIEIDIYVLTFLAPPIEGPFLSGGGMFPTFFAWTFNPQSGVLMVGCTRLGNVPGVSGTGKIATVRVIADEPEATTIIDLFDEKKYDSNFMLIPEGEPGDSVLTIQWPPELWDTELWLQKIWPEHKVLYMTWCCEGYVLVWSYQVIFARIKNNGTAGVYVRVWLTFISESGVSENWDPWNDIPLTTGAAYIGPGETVIVSMPAGCVDPWFCIWNPDALALECGWFYVAGLLQISTDGLRWYNWGDFDPPLPGYGFSRETPGGDTAKFKVFPYVPPWT